MRRVATYSTNAKDPGEMGFEIRRVAFRTLLGLLKWLPRFPLFSLFPEACQRAH
jgi:hypothetical protein